MLTRFRHTKRYFKYCLIPSSVYSTSTPFRRLKVESIELTVGKGVELADKVGRSGVNICKKNNAYNLCRLISVL